VLLLLLFVTATSLYQLQPELFAMTSSCCVMNISFAISASFIEVAIYSMIIQRCSRRQEIETITPKKSMLMMTV
jgi:hypothetical protein